jgi:hypothetical protein
MTDRRVARRRLDDVRRPLVGPADQRPLDPAMLVAERDLEVEDLLAVALEAEVARLDHSGVHRPDGDLVDSLALDAEEVGDARRRRRIGRVLSAPRRVVADRLEPGMPDGADAELLGDLALEHVRLRAAGSERFPRIAGEPRPDQPELARLV